jgi:hypothetical protein
MPAFHGSRAELGIGKETTRGTAAAPSYGIRRDDLTLDDKIEQVIDASTRGIIEDAIDASKSAEIAEGEATFIIRDKSFGLWLLSIFGAVSSAVKSGETVVYEHTYTVQQGNQHQSLTLHLKTPVGGKDFALAMIESAELNVELERHAYARVAVKAKKGAAATRTISYDTAENIFLPTHGTFKTAANLAGLPGAAAINIKKFTLSIAKNLEVDRVLGNLAPNDILNKGFVVSGTVELLYSDDTFITELLGDTAKAMRITLTNTDKTIGSASNPKLNIDFARVKFSEVARSLDKGDLSRITVNYKAFYSEADSKMVEAILTNLVSSY